MTPSLVAQGWVGCFQQAIVGVALLYLTCVSGGLFLELLAAHLRRLEVVLRVVHKTRDCVACLFLFAPLFALGALWLPARAHKIAIFQQSFIDPPKHYTGWYVLFSIVVLSSAAALSWWANRELP